MAGIDDLGTPNCETCLHPLELTGTTDHPYWWCPRCRVAVLYS